MSKAAKQGLILLILLLLVALGFAGYLALEKNKLEKEIVFLNSELDQADKNIKEKTKKIGNLNKEVRGLTDTKLDLEQQLASAKQAQKNLQENLSKVTSQKDNLQRRVNLLKGEAEKLGKEVAELRARPPEVVEKVVEKVVYRDRVPEDGVVSARTEQSGERRQESQKPEPIPDGDDDEYWAAVLKEKAELEVKIENFKGDLSKSSMQVVELKRENADLQLELDGIKHNKEEIEREIKYKTDLINNLSLELARAKNDKKFVADRVDKLNQENKKLRTELRKLVSVKGSLEKSIVRLSDEKKKLSKQLEQTDGMVQHKIDEIWEIKESLDENFAASRNLSVQKEIELPPIVVNSAGKGNEPAINFNPDQTTPGFNGRVLSINDDNNFVIVDVGQTAGVRLGDTLSVYRDSKYVGRLEVIQVRKDIAAADIKDQWSRIKVGDVIR